MIFELNNFIAKRGGVKIEPFEVTGNNFRGTVHKDESGLFSTIIKRETKDELGEIEFIFRWDIKIGENTLLAQFIYPFSYENKQEKPTEDEFMALVYKAWDEVNEYFNYEILRRNIEIAYPRVKGELSITDKIYTVGALDKAFD